MDVLKPEYVAKRYPYTTLMNCEFYNHRHSFWEFIICVKGSATHFIDDKKYRFSVGDIIIMKPDSVHNYKITDNKSGDYLHYDFYAAAAEMKKACDNLSVGLYERLVKEKEPVHFSLDSPVLTMLESKLSRLNSIQLTEKLEKSAAIIYSTVLNLICGLTAENSVSMEQQIPDWLTRLMSDMAKPETLRDKLCEIVKRSGYTHSHLCRLFKKHMGITLIEHFTRLKMDYANLLLKDSGINILNIALSLGYDSPSHFIQVFKKYNGATPMHYRNTLYPRRK